tara:strand:+ start:689 stop:826 length:138 start_codon:yes stop_codon:yes gene_type:complete
MRRPKPANVLSEKQKQAIREPWRAEEILRDVPGGLEWWTTTGQYM